MSDQRPLKPVVISAPFGNYIQPEGATATLGTFTRLKRPGRLVRIVRTVRYYRRLGAWVNKIGLRNPGIDWLVSKVEAGKVDVSDKLVSVHGFEEADWWTLLDACARIKPLGIELNISCPNVGEMSWPKELFTKAIEAAGSFGGRVVVKLPPVRFEGIARDAIASGVRTFHCCNTLPVPAGGMSGKPLMPVSLVCIAEVLGMARAEGVDIEIIGGGGITTASDIDTYAEAGASSVAMGTKVMHPRYVFGEADLRGLIDHAAARLRGAGLDK